VSFCSESFVVDLQVRYRFFQCEKYNKNDKSVTLQGLKEGCVIMNQQCSAVCQMALVLSWAYFYV